MFHTTSYIDSILAASLIADVHLDEIGAASEDLPLAITTLLCDMIASPKGEAISECAQG